MKVSEALKLKIEGLFNRKVISIERVYAGHWQRSRGAWSWFAILENGPSVGSCYTMTECVKAKKLEKLSLTVVDVELFPEN